MKISVLIVVGVAVVIMFIFPTMAVLNNQDDITQVAAQQIVSEFVNNAATKGKITPDDYNDCKSKLVAIGVDSLELEHKIMTVNPNKGDVDKPGENLFYSVFNETILGEDGILLDSYKMNKDDYLVATAKNTHPTHATQFNSFLFSLVGKDIDTIVVSASAPVSNDG